jgi:outer membrane cobalamin receptor
MNPYPYMRCLHRCIRIYVLLPLALYAQSNGSIQGRVLSRNTGNPLEGSNVILVGTVLGTSTDPSGRFTIQRILPGTYSLHISMMGYGTETVRDIMVQPGKTTEIVIRMDETVVVSDPIIVTASKHTQSLSTSPQSVTVIPHSRIEERQSRRLEETLNDVAGIHFNEDNISIRGSSSWSAFNVGSRVLLLIDGVPFLVSDIGGISWDTLPLLDIDRIEVVKGAGSALYGSAAIGGVINMITKSPTPRGCFQMRTVAGIYDQPHYDVWHWTNRTLHYEGVDVAYSKQIGPVGFRFSISRFVSTGYMENNATDRWNGTGRAVYRFRNDSRLEIYGSWVQVSRGGFIQWLDQNSPFEVPAYNKDDEIHFRIMNFYTTYLLPLSSRLGLKFRLSSTLSRAGNQLTSADPGAFEPSQGPGCEIQVNWIPWKKHIVTLGSEFRWDISGAEYFGSHQGHTISPYVQDEWCLLPSLRTTVGLRLDSHTLINEEKDTHISPKFGINYQPFSTTVIRASAGSGFRAATVFEKYITADYSGFTIIPNPGLRPEHSLSLDIGLDQTLLENSHVGISVFQNDAWDMIEAVRDIQGTIQFQNYVRARIRGVECTAESWWWSRRICLRGNITWLDPRNLVLDTILPYRPEMSYILSASFRLKPFLLQAEYRYASRFDNVEINPLDPRVPLKLLNLRAQIIWKGLTFQLAVNNALNYHYTQIERRMGEIRNASLTVLVDTGK